MSEIKTEFLFTIALEVQVFSLGNTPYGGRRIFSFNTGRCFRFCSSHRASITAAM